MADRTVLISGIGIAGPTLAHWLLRYGYRPTLVDIAPALRTSGYMIDFWGLGYDVAERMDLIPALRRIAYDINEVRLVDGRGDRIAGINVSSIRAVTRNRFFSILRSDLAREIFRTIEGRAEVIFGDRVTALQQDGDGAQVSFATTATRRFDLVVGADGLHSEVRQLAFGTQPGTELYLGYCVASFGVPAYPYRDESTYVGHTMPGRQIARYALRGNRTVFLFIWVEEERPVLGHHDLAVRKKILRERFRGIGWESDAILERLDACDDLYFDTVSQVRMDAWTCDRVALVGDAAFCPSLLAGEGASLAMAGAYVLAGELHRAGGDCHLAFGAYERFLRPYIVGKQDGALRLGAWFAPRTRIGLAVRNQITRMMSWPWIGDWFMRSMIGNAIKLPRYRD